MAKEKKSHDQHGNHAKHHQMLERNSYKVLKKKLSWRSYGDHLGTKEAHTKCWRKKRLHDYHMETI
jgi:hypothetical protein